MLQAHPSQPPALGVLQKQPCLLHCAPQKSRPRKCQARSSRALGVGARCSCSRRPRRAQQRVGKEPKQRQAIAQALFECELISQCHARPHHARVLQAAWERAGRRWISGAWLQAAAPRTACRGSRAGRAASSGSSAPAPVQWTLTCAPARRGGCSPPAASPATLNVREEEVWMAKKEKAFTRKLMTVAPRNCTGCAAMMANPCTSQRSQVGASLVGGKCAEG